MDAGVSPTFRSTPKFISVQTFINHIHCLIHYARVQNLWAFAFRQNSEPRLYFSPLEQVSIIV